MTILLIYNVCSRAKLSRRQDRERIEIIVFFLKLTVRYDNEFEFLIEREKIAVEIELSH
jgi:hypothetical protein